MKSDLPVRPCHECGPTCDWCVGSNQARRAFPRAIKPPVHDADHDKPEEHHCVACFVKVAEVVRCNPTRSWDKEGR